MDYRNKKAALIVVVIAKIDLYTPKKFGVLKAYLDEYGLNGGIVRNDATIDELCICMDHYSDDIGSDDWKVLESVLP